MNAFPAMRARIPMPPRSSIPLFNRRALVSAAMAFPMIALAEDPAPPVELPAVVIQSSALARTAEELVHPVDVIADDELQRLQRGTIGDVLADRPGIANASFGPGAGRPVIRGQGGPRVQVLENGIGSMDASTISADHAVSVDPLGAEQIEVIKGPATLIYGSAASAGVVNVIDDRLPDEVTPGLRLRSDLSYGSNADEKKAAAKARYGNSSVQVGADYSRRSAGDFSIPGYAERQHEGEVADEEMVSGRLDNSSLRSERYGASTAWSGKRGMIGAAVSRYESNYGIPGGHAHEHDHEHEGEEEEEGHSHEGVRIDLEQTRFDGRGLLNDPLPGFESLELRFGINDYEHREVEASGEIGTTFKVRELNGRAQLKHRPLSGWTGVVGLHVGDRDFEAVGEEAAFAPPVVTRGLGLFVVEGREVGAHRVEVGARVDRIEHDAADPASPDRDFTPLSLSAGVNFMLSEHLHLRVNGQRAQRAPASEELYANGAHLATSSFERGDTTLKEETANTLDLSLERDQGRWTWTASTYLNYVQDYVFLREVDGDGDGVADRVDETGAVEPDGELLEDNQKIIGAVTRGMIDLLGRSANSQQGFAKGMLDPLNRRRYDNGQDYEFNPNQNPAHNLIEHKYPEIPQSAILMLNLQQSDAEGMTGVKAFGNGLGSDAYGKVATGIRGVLDAASKREMAILRRLAKGMVEIAQKIMSMNAEFLSEKEVVRVTNKEYVTVKREDLKGNFDLETDISTAEVDNQQSQDLAFMLQTMGPNMEPQMSYYVMSEIARLKRMPVLAERLRTFEPKPDPLTERLKEAEVKAKELEAAKLQSEIDLNAAKIQQIGVEARQGMLDGIEQETGTKHAREMDKQAGQARGNQDLQITKALTEKIKDGDKRGDIEAGIGFNQLSDMLRGAGNSGTSIFAPERTPLQLNPYQN